MVLFFVYLIFYTDSVGSESDSPFDKSIIRTELLAYVSVPFLFKGEGAGAYAHGVAVFAKIERLAAIHFCGECMAVADLLALAFEHRFH